MNRSETLRHRQSKNKVINNEASTRMEQESNRGYGSCKAIFLACTVAVAGILSYGYLKSPLSSISITDSHDTQAISWARERNKDLQRGERFVGNLPAPESIAVDDSGNLYTGLIDGKVMKITGFGTAQQSEVDLTNMATYNAGGAREGRRPFGVRLHQNKLYLADAFQGVFAIDLTDLTWDKIVGYNDLPQPLMFPNDLVLTKDGKTLYFTDCSCRWTYAERAWSLTEGECSGRIVKVDLQENRVNTLITNLCFPNGLELSPDESKLLVSEFGRHRISVFELSTLTVYSRILLPGGPDNIRRGIAGGYWVPLAVWRGPHWYHTERFPFLRDAIAGLLSHDLIFYLNVLRQGTSGTVIKLDDKFGIESVHFDKEGKYCKSISEFHEYSDGKFFVGSYAVNGIVKLDWSRSRD